MKNTFTLILFNFFLIVSISAQEKENTIQFWINGGTGQSISETFIQNPGLVVGTGFVLSHKQQLISLQLNHFWESDNKNQMEGEFNEWKIQYGWINNKKRDQFYVMGGVGYSESNQFKEVFIGNDGMSIQKDWTLDTALGFVVETGVNFIINEHIGIGFSSFGNLNKNSLTAGYRVNILLGLFKNYKK